jgi:uncharacterized protein (TIGR02145 family)
MKYSPIALFLLAFEISLLNAQVPDSLTYQAIIRNNEGVALIDQQVTIQISILQGSVYGKSMYVELHEVISNQFGLVTLVIGGGEVQWGNFENINWSNGPYFIKVELDLFGGTEFSIVGTTQLLSVPYALHAKTAENSFSGDYNDLDNKPDFTNWDNDISDDFSGNYIDLIDKPDFTNWDDDVSDDFSGNYNDLTNKPVIPAINDGAVSAASLWSSSKTNSELSNKIDAAVVYTKTNLQTAGQAVINYGNLSQKPVNIDEDKTDDVTLIGTQTIQGSKTFTNKINANNGINANNATITNVGGPALASDAVNKAYVDALEAKLDNMESMLMENGLMLKDIDDNFYKIIKIGNQIWMAGDLKTTKYNDGTEIPNIPNTNDWIAMNSPAFCYFNNDISYKYLYGTLYNWYAVNTGKLCPTGWHVPSDGEWKTLEMYLGMSQVQADDLGWRGTSEGGKIKEVGTAYWNNPNTGATNESGFTSIPSGLRDNQTGAFYWVGMYAHYWTSTEDGETNAYDRDVVYNNSQIFRYPNSKKYGFIVRCIKD